MAQQGAVGGYISGRSGLSIPLWLVWAAALVFVAGGLGSFGILDNNEGLYAEIPREMLASHDWRLWVIPHLNGLPYMEKPPLLYWLTALSFALFGESEWAARLVPALSSLACVALLLSFGRAVRRPQAARLAALMFVSGVGVTAMSHVLMFDMLLTALLTAALMLAYRYLEEERAALLRWSYAFLALALLAKGFVALILFGMVIAAFVLASVRSFSGLGRACAKWFDPFALLVFFAIAAPWHIAASLTEPIFPWFYFINEHVLRFLGQREPHDYYSGKWWYYLPRMAIYLFPWSFLLFGMAASRRRDERQESRALRRFLFAAWAMPLLFFSVSSAKANYYLVAVMPFAALHLALALENHGFLTPLARLLPGGLIAVLSIVVLLVLTARIGQADSALTVMGLPQHQFLQYFFSGVAFLAVAAALLAWRVARIGVLAYLLVPAWTAFGLMAVLHAMEPLVSTRLLASVLQGELRGWTVYLYRNFEEQSSLPFYLKHPVPVVDMHSNDLYWGNKLRANGIVISTDQFRTAIKARPVAIVVMKRQLQAFADTGLAVQFKGERRVGDTTVFFN
ncbi:MAG TPA: glycosyltransferase family 39 protein [Noviherbaspirillum sp.]|nr:glycosyltransferase family 39 protein [Noviherbaspirillum sp.]